MEMQIVGAIKVKDGLFIGDELAAKVNLETVLQQYNTYPMLPPFLRRCSYLLSM